MSPPLLHCPLTPTPAFAALVSLLGPDVPPAMTGVGPLSRRSDLQRDQLLSPESGWEPPLLWTLRTPHDTCLLFSIPVRSWRHLEARLRRRPGE